MTLTLRNKWHYKGDDRWKWEAFLDDEGSGELSNVDYVEYILHPTFKEPIRRISDAEGGFALKTEGWGEFDLKAFARMKDGSKRSLSHSVKLEYDPPTGVTV
jgi:transcription initiation factor IIF auxiliary subunit